MDFVNQSAGGTMQLIRIDKTNGSVIDSIQWCLPYTLGFLHTGSNMWGLSSGASFGLQRIHMFESLLLSDGNGIENIDELSIYPIPASEKLNIKYSEEFQIEIFNSKGMLVTNKYKCNRHETVDVSNFSNGIYIIRITNDKITTHTKFLKN